VRQTERQTEIIQAEDRKAERQTDVPRQTDRQPTDKYTYRQTDREACRQTDVSEETGYSRKTDRQTENTDLQFTNSQGQTCFIYLILKQSFYSDAVIIDLFLV
jgi:hypothetical protein